MALEMPQKSFRKQVAQIQNKEITGTMFTEDEALDKLRSLVEEKLSEALKKGTALPKVDISEKNKEYLRNLKRYYFDIVMDCLEELNMSILGYRTHEAFAEMAVAEFAGYSILEDAFNDAKVTDIFILAWDCIFIEKNGSVPEKYHKTFKSQKHLKLTIDRLVREGAEKEVNNGRNRILDCDIFQDRYCITAPTVSPRDYSVTIRKHSESHVQLQEILQKKVCNVEIANFIGTTFKGESNVIIAGITGSGKTTTLRALIDFYISKLGRRIITCEDVRELFLSNPHTLEMVTVKNDDPNLEVTLGRLILTALRQKPKYLCVGEVRGVEILGMIEGMETGHSVLTTMHGETWINVVNRTITKYLMAMPSLSVEIAERIIGSALDYVVIQSDIPGVGRKIKSITEISYDFENKKIVGKPIFEYDFDTNDWNRLNDVSDDKLLKMRGRGVTVEDINKYLKKGA